MKRRRITRKTCSSSKRSWAASALAGPLLAALLLAGASCSPDKGKTPPSAGEGDVPSLLAESWVTRYVAKDERIARLLTDQGEGWLGFREMNLPEAVDAFDRFGGGASRIGMARAYLEMAETGGALDRLLLDVETAYLGAAGEKAKGWERGRRAFALLRRGDTAGAGDEFGKEPPQG